MTSQELKYCAADLQKKNEDLSVIKQQLEEIITQGKKDNGEFNSLTKTVENIKEKKLCSNGTRCACFQDQNCDHVAKDKMCIHETS